MIAASRARVAKTKYRLYVPDNTGDLVASAWSRGDETKTVKRTEKDIRPIHLNDEGRVSYLFPLVDSTCPHVEVLVRAARSITHLGWGVDMVVADGAVLSDRDVAALSEECWYPGDSVRGKALRVPTKGTLNALREKHAAFLSRVRLDDHGLASFHPVPPLSSFSIAGYRRGVETEPRPFAVFELRQDDGTLFSYSQEKLIHLAGMLRHLSIAAMRVAPPEGLADNWLETYVAGHVPPNENYGRLSYLPLPSIGHAHADQAVRRVMIAAPVGDDKLLAHLAKRLAGQQLRPTAESRIDQPPTLERVRNDNVARFYTAPSNSWASVTPVILPGHDDHKSAKTQKLVEAALRQSGIEQSCEFEWSAISCFPKSLSAHKYGLDKRPAGYIRPNHLLSQTAVHLKLRFHDGVEVPGPLVIGAGRHCGFGLMAGIR